MHLMQNSDATIRRLTAERAQYIRVVLAFHDCQEAAKYAQRVCSLDSQHGDSRDYEVDRAALISALVVSYGRCFVESQAHGRSLPQLSGRYLRSLSKLEAELHTRMLALRHQEFAHSDADAASVTVTVWEGAVLVPHSRILRVYSLGAEDVRVALDVVQKLQTFLAEEMLRFQARLSPEGDFPGDAV